MAFQMLFRKKTKAEKYVMDSRVVSASTPLNASPVHTMKIDLKRVFSVIEFNGLQFVILDCPSDSTLPTILSEFKRLKVTDVVRVCEPTYNAATLIAEGINVLDVPYIDGGTPPQHVILKFLGLVQERFGDVFPMKQKFPAASFDNAIELKKSRGSLNLNMDRPTIAVHCVAGMGRAPVLIAIALMEHGMPNLDAIDYIRAQRRGAFNNLQIVYIDRYKKVLTKSGEGTWFKSFVNKMPKSGKTKSSDN